MKRVYFLKTIGMTVMAAIFSISAVDAQTINGEIKISEKSDLSQKSHPSPHKNKSHKTKRKKKSRHSKKKKSD